MKKAITLLLFLIPAWMNAQESNFYVGKVQPGNLMNGKDKGEWLPEYENYGPDASAVKYIKNFKGKVKMKVIMAYWDAESKIQVPRMLRILESAKWDVNDNDQFKMWAVDENKQIGFEGYAQMAITQVPTFMVFVDNREIGRIVMRPKESLEEDLVEILKKIK